MHEKDRDDGGPVEGVRVTANVVLAAAAGRQYPVIPAVAVLTCIDQDASRRFSS